MVLTALQAASHASDISTLQFVVTVLVGLLLTVVQAGLIFVVARCLQAPDVTLFYNTGSRTLRRLLSQLHTLLARFQEQVRERSGRRVRSSRSSGTIASSVATTRELSQRPEQLRVLLVHRTNIPPQFFALDSILSTARLHIAVPHSVPV